MTTTAIGLHKGCQEFNPLYGYRPSISRVVLTKGVSTFLVSSIAWGIRKEHPKHAKAILIIGIVASGGAAVWNVTQLPRC